MRNFLLLSWKGALCTEALTVATLILVGNLLRFHLIGWRNWSVHIEYRLHGLEWSCVNVDATVKGFGDRLKHLGLRGRGGGLLRRQGHGDLQGVNGVCLWSGFRVMRGLIERG